DAVAEQLLLRPEVAVDHRFGHTRDLGDHVHRRHVIAVLREHLHRRVEDLLLADRSGQPLSPFGRAPYVLRHQYLPLSGQTLPDQDIQAVDTGCSGGHSDSITRRCGGSWRSSASGTTSLSTTITRLRLANPPARSGPRRLSRRSHTRRTTLRVGGSSNNSPAASVMNP